MNKKLKKRRNRIVMGGIIFLTGVVISRVLPGSQLLILAVFLAAYATLGYDIIWKVFRNMGRGTIFDENFLMSLATVGAFIVGDYAEGVMVMLLYQIGELFQSYAVNRSRKSISELMNIRPDYANVRRGEELIQVDPSEVQVGEMILVKPGERIPLDGCIKEGSSILDTKELTGESIPKDVGTGDTVISGCINIGGVIEIEVEKSFGESTVSKILDLVENSSANKAEAENFITKFAKYYTPIVVIGALILAFLPPLVLGGKEFQVWIYRALTFLVISCPCALVISVPLSFFGGLGGASRQGILVKGSNYLETLVNAEIIVMDKTGTLTKGNFIVTKIQSGQMKEQQLLEYTALAESYSNHPISQSLLKAYGKPIDSQRIKQVEELPGHGVKAFVDEQEVYAGNARMMRRQNIDFEEVTLPGTVVYVAIQGTYAGYILISDELKEDAKEAIAGMRQFGVKELVMLTGDNRITGENIAQELGIDQVYTDLLPGDKVDRMEVYRRKTSEKGKLVFVGDGINDAPVLAGADLGIAMGGLGSDAAIEAADIVIMTDEPSKIVAAMKLARKTLRIVKQNIVFAIGVKVIALLLAALGMVSMGIAIFADVGVMILAVCNAIRTLKNDI